MLIKSSNGSHYNFWPEKHIGKAVGSFDLIGNANNPDKPLEIWSFGIHEEENRGKGYGQQMLIEAIAHADGRPIRLYVYKDNFVAIHVYEKFGFKIVGKFMGERAWVMQHDGNAVAHEKELSMAC